MAQAQWFMSDLVRNLEDRFSCVMAHTVHNDTVKIMILSSGAHWLSGRTLDTNCCVLEHDTLHVTQSTSYYPGSGGSILA